MRQVDERLWTRMVDGRPVPTGQGLQTVGAQLRGGVGAEHEEQHIRPAPQDGEDERDHDPHEPLRPDVAQPLEDEVQRPDPVGDDPPIETTVETEHRPR